jgi:hypothetical protein
LRSRRARTEAGADQGVQALDAEVRQQSPVAPRNILRRDLRE